MFGTFQGEIGNEIAQYTNLVDNDDILMKMHDIIPQIWKSHKYAKLAEKHISGYDQRVQSIIDNKGDILSKYR